MCTRQKYLMQTSDNALLSLPSFHIFSRILPRNMNASKWYLHPGHFSRYAVLCPNFFSFYCFNVSYFFQEYITDIIIIFLNRFIWIDLHNNKRKVHFIKSMKNSRCYSKFQFRFTAKLAASSDWQPFPLNIDLL